MPRIIKKIFELIKDDKHSWITIFILDLCINIATIINPLIYSVIINMITQGHTLNRIINMVLIMVLSGLIGNFIVYKKMILRAKANNWIVNTNLDSFFKVM